MDMSQGRRLNQGLHKTNRLFEVLPPEQECDQLIENIIAGVDRNLPSAKVMIKAPHFLVGRITMMP